MQKQSDKNNFNAIAPHIVLAGGGSGGPVTPLLAVADAIKKDHPEAQFILIGTCKGPERHMAAEKNILFKAISAGRLRRYLSFKSILQTISAPFESMVGFLQARRLLKKFNANAVIAAGGFVSVPVGYAAWSLGIPVLIHQQDIQSTLSNTLLSPIADAITVTFKSSLHDFNHTSGLHSVPMDAESKSTWTGNPVRSEFIVAKENEKNQEWLNAARSLFKITDDRPVLLITGGGTGASGLNEIIMDALPQLLVRFTVIHSTGAGKQINFAHQHYHSYEFISKMAEAYASSDLVISRAGIAAITEISAMSKPSIIIPMPESHQEDNAAYLRSRDAALVLHQNLLNAEQLVSIVTSLLYDTDKRAALSQSISEIMPHDAAQRIAEIVLRLCQSKTKPRH